jgi:hypothetical protein
MPNISTKPQQQKKNKTSKRKTRTTKKKVVVSETPTQNTNVNNPSSDEADASWVLCCIGVIIIAIILAILF